MMKKKLLTDAAPIISMLYARGALDSPEKKELLDALRSEKFEAAAGMLAGKLLEKDAPDIRALYCMLREA